MLPCLWCGKGMSFNRGCSQLSQGCKRLLLYFLFRRKKNPDTFLMEICSWIEKMCFWLVFAFSQDSRFILSVRRSKRNEELSGILFLQCVLRDSKHLLFFFFQEEIGANSSNLYAVRDGRNFRKHQELFKGNFICILGRIVFHSEMYLC